MGAFNVVKDIIGQLTGIVVSLIALGVAAGIVLDLAFLLLVEY